MATYTTQQAAAKVGISRATLHHWISAGKVKAPEPIQFGPGTVRLWTEADIASLRRVKKDIYRKHLGRPKKRKG